MLTPWHLLANSEVFRCSPFGIIKKRYESQVISKSPDAPGSFEAYVIDAPPWANVIGMTKDQEILLIRQYRFGTDRVELEIPGGVVEAGETPLHGIQREFEEETGYVSSEWKQIGVVDANPAIQNNRCYTFLAREIAPTGRVHFDPNEEIECELVPLENVRALIRDGEITNTYIIAAFYWLEQEIGTIT